MKKTAASILGVGLLVLLTHCTHQSQVTCTGDWYELGRRDGAQGKTLEKLEKRKDACGSLSPSQITLYKNGRNAGLAEYCSPENGYDLGRSGDDYNGVCPPILEDAFLKEYKRGKKAFALEQKNQKLSQKISDIFKKLEKSSLSRVEKISLRSKLSSLKRSRANTKKRLSRIKKKYN